MWSETPEEKEELNITRETDFGVMKIMDTFYGDEPVRMLLVDDTQESATYREPWRRNELVFPYTQCIAALFGEPEDLGPVRVLLIGAAGCSLVKYFIAHYPEGRMDVVELHREMIEAARMYFYLGELEENLQVAHMDRLRIYISDGMKYLERFVAQGKQPRYDMIINDAYIGDHLDVGLQSPKGLRLIHEALVPDGLYCLNIITAVDGVMAMPGLMQKELAAEEFIHADLVQCNLQRDPKHRQNCLLLATDKDLPVSPQEFFD